MFREIVPTPPPSAVPLVPIVFAADVVAGRSYKEVDGIAKKFDVKEILDSHCVGKVHLETNRGTWCMTAVTPLVRA